MKLESFSYIYTSRSFVSEMFGNLPKVRQLVSDKSRISFGGG